MVLLSRAKRLHLLFKEMALDLARDHRVVVLAAPEQLESFAAAGIDVRPYETSEMSTWREGMATDPGIDLRNIGALERELNLTAYKAASNYLLYGRMVRSFGGYWRYIETADDILYTYGRAYRQLSDLFRTVRPDVVFYETIDVISSYVAMAMAARHGIFGLEFRFAPLGEGKIMPAYGLYRRNPLLEYLHAHPEEIERSSYAHADDVLKAVPEYVQRASYSRVHRKMMRRDAGVLRRRLASAVREPDSLGRGFRNLKWHWRTTRNRRWLERKLDRRMPAQPYIVFFMQHLPEASTCSQAPRWVYQDMIVEQLAINAPSTLEVVVKEHPRSFGLRGKAFFEPLQRLANVRICHPSVDTSELIAGAEAVLTVTSTVGFEGVLRGKRVAVLGRPFYSAFDGVKTLDHPADIYPLLSDPCWRPETKAAERRQFLAAYLQSLQDFGVGEGTAVYPATGGANWARALRQTMDFLQSRGLKPSDFDSGL